MPFSALYRGQNIQAGTKSMFLRVLRKGFLSGIGRWSICNCVSRMRGSRKVVSLPIPGMYSGRLRALLAEIGGLGPRPFRTGDGTKYIKPIPRWQFKVGDIVQIIAGDDKGKRGKILEILKYKNKVVVEGLHQQVRVQRATVETRGQMVLKESPIHISNVALIDPKTDKPTRLTKPKFLQNGTKVRVSKKSGAIIPKPPGPSGKEPFPLVKHEYLTPPEEVFKVTYTPVSTEAAKKLTQKKTAPRRPTRTELISLLHEKKERRRQHTLQEYGARDVDVIAMENMKKYAIERLNRLQEKIDRRHVPMTVLDTAK